MLGFFVAIWAPGCCPNGQRAPRSKPISTLLFLARCARLLTHCNPDHNDPLLLFQQIEITHLYSFDTFVLLSSPTPKLS